MLRPGRNESKNTDNYLCVELLWTAINLSLKNDDK